MFEPLSSSRSCGLCKRASERLRGSRRRPRQALVVALVALSILAAPNVVCAVLDPFYVQLEGEGIQAYERGDFATAAADLRLACFGMLEEPSALVHCLVYLALAQAEVGDSTALRRTFDRISEVERDFEAFSQLNLAMPQRQALEGHLRREIPYDALRRLPVFAGVARQQLEEQIRAMPSAERRAELERRIEAEPHHGTWQVLMAELELEDGDSAAALAAAEAVLGSQPGHPHALCLRGRAAAAGSGACEQALVDLESCAESESPSALNLARTRCHIALGDWDAAELALATLRDSDVRSSTLRQLSRTIKRGRKSRPAAETSETPETLGALPEEAGDDLSTASAEQAVVASQEEASEDGASQDGTSPDVTTQDGASQDGASQGDAAQQDGDSSEIAEEATRDSEETPALAQEPKIERVDPTAEQTARFTELLRAGTREDLESASSQVNQLADAHPERSEIQLLAAEVAYRLSRWEAAVTYFDRGGVFESGRPEHQFYLAVALYESGDRVSARDMLERCLPQLEQTAFVRAYSERINSGG